MRTRNQKDMCQRWKQEGEPKSIDGKLLEVFEKGVIIDYVSFGENAQDILVSGLYLVADVSVVALLSCIAVV